MARPKGVKNKATLRKEKQDTLETLGEDWTIGLTPGQILEVVQTRFEVMNRMVMSALKSEIRSTVISGAPGIGKTYTVEQALKDKYQETNGAFRYKVIKGNISPIGLYKVLYDYRNKGDVVLLDDTDSIFFDPSGDGVSILKAALDSTPRRIVSWNSEAASLNDIGTEFDYEGTMMFITNTDFQAIVDKGTSKVAVHFEALISRTIYLDLMVHHRKSIAVWVSYMVQRTHMLMNHYNITKDQEMEAINWLLQNSDDLRTLSLRDAMKLGQFMKSDPKDWISLAEVTLLKNIKGKKRYQPES